MPDECKGQAGCLKWPARAVESRSDARSRVSNDATGSRVTSLEPELVDSPREALPALGNRVERMVRERGIPAGEPSRTKTLRSSSSRCARRGRPPIASIARRTSTLATWPPW